MLSRVYLSAAIKSARANAAMGDIFTPLVTRLVRTRLATALRGRDADEFLEELFAEHPYSHSYRPQVHDPYPDWASHEMPTVLLYALPPLPEDVEYRLIGRDLVLWDSHADLIIDVVVNAIPARSAETT
jgi:hypothetical protein